MIGKSLWQQIKDVVDYDRALAALKDEINSIEQSLATDRIKSKNQENIEKEKQQSISKHQKELLLKELDIKDLKAREDRKRTQLAHTSGQKEYMALEREITSLTKLRATHEEEIVKLMYTIDVLKQDFENFMANKDECSTRLLNEIAAKDANLIRLHEKASALTESRTTALQQVAPEWRTQYERMRHSVPDPIVPVLHESCSVCFYAISPQNLIRLKRSDVLVCMNCYRFLYYEADVAKDTDKAEY